MMLRDVPMNITVLKQKWARGKMGPRRLPARTLFQGRFNSNFRHKKGAGPGRSFRASEANSANRPKYAVH